jgi:uncharacterized protein with HEPN domain/predicted nucleotidyltransferase
MSAVPDKSAAAGPGSRPGQALLSGPRLEAVAELCRRFHVRTLDVFGSAMTGRFDPARSDIDFLVEFEEARGEGYAKHWLGLEQGLAALFGRPVDLLCESSVENPFLRRSIEATKRRLFPPSEFSDDGPIEPSMDGPIEPSMSDKQPAKYLWDALRAAERIARFTSGRTFDEYLSDDMLRDAVERRFQVIGEALAGLRRIDPALAAKVPDLAEIIAFRNILVHAYSDINHQQVWRVIERDLPDLRATLDRLLADASGP